MKPPEEYTRLFSSAVKSLGSKRFSSATTAAEAIQKLIRETDGAIITEFLDSGNWDSLELARSLDDSHLVLYLRSPQSQPRADQEVLRAIGFPEVHGLFMEFQELRIIDTRAHPILYLRGWAGNMKKVRQALGGTKNEWKVKETRDFSATAMRLRASGEAEYYRYPMSPFWWMMFLPKATPFDSSSAHQLLQRVNLHEVGRVVEQLKQELYADQAATDSIIAQKGGALRSAFEATLKFECFYRMVGIKASYSHATLGPLVKALRPLKTETEFTNLNRLVRIANELSHDSGRPIVYSDALTLAEGVADLCAALDQVMISEDDDENA